MAGSPPSLHSTIELGTEMEPSRAAVAWWDLIEGFNRSWMWSALALQDIKLRYRGSVLGPFWLTLSMIIMIGALGALYSRIFHMEVAHYLPYLTVSLITWQYISGVVTEGCQTFLTVSSVIQQVPMPFSLHAYRVVCRNLMVVGHHLVIIPVVLFIFEVKPDWAELIIVIPAVALLAINGVWISLLFGILSTRFRDIPPIVASFLQVVFFITPVFWTSRSLGHMQAIADWNPLAAMIDIVRAPILGVAPEPMSWPLVLGLTVFGSLFTFAFFARFRTRIAYWL